MLRNYTNVRFYRSLEPGLRTTAIEHIGLQRNISTVSLVSLWRVLSPMSDERRNSIATKTDKCVNSKNCYQSYCPTILPSCVNPKDSISGDFTVKIVFYDIFLNTHFIWRECIPLSTTKINILTHNIYLYINIMRIFIFLSKFYLTKYAFQINHKQWSLTSFIALAVPSLRLFIWLVAKVLA